MRRVAKLLCSVLPQYARSRAGAIRIQAEVRRKITLVQLAQKLRAAVLLQVSPAPFYRSALPPFLCPSSPCSGHPRDARAHPSLAVGPSDAHLPYPYCHTSDRSAPCDGCIMQAAVRRVIASNMLHGCMLYAASYMVVWCTLCMVQAAVRRIIASKWLQASKEGVEDVPMPMPTAAVRSGVGAHALKETAAAEPTIQSPVAKRPTSATLKIVTGAAMLRMQVARAG